MDDEGASASGSNVSSETQGFSLVTSEYQKAKRKKYFAERNATKISLYSEQFERWQKLKMELEIKADKDLVALLIDQYYANKQIITKR